MTVSSDPNALALLQQGALATSGMSAPGPLPLDRVRAKLTADDGLTPLSFAWIEVEADINGALFDKPDGLSGTLAAGTTKLFNPAREMNNQKPPSYPWYVWLEPRGDFGDIGVVWEVTTGMALGGGSGGNASNPTFSGVRVFSYWDQHAGGHQGIQGSQPNGCVIYWDGVHFDTSNYWRGKTPINDPDGTDFKRARLVAPVSGYYHVGLNLNCSDEDPNTFALVVNGSDAGKLGGGGGVTVATGVQGMDSSTIDVSTVTYLNKDDYVQAEQTGDPTVVNDAITVDDNVFWMYFLGS